MNIYEEKINILCNEINKIKISRDKRAKNINTFLWLLLIAIDVLLYIKIKDISLFTKYQNTLLEILRYVITGCSCLIVDATLYTIGDIYNFKLYEKIENLKKEIINNLSYIPGIKNDYAFYNSLYNQIVKKVYNRDVNEIIDTLNNRKDIPIKVCSLISIMPKKHLTYFYKALEELNNYIISKRNIVNSNVVNSLYDMAVSNGVKVYDTIKKESKTTPYKDLVSEVKKGGKR